MLFSIYILISAAYTHTHAHTYISVCGPEGELTAPSTHTFDNTLLQKEIFSPVAAELTSSTLIPPDNLLFVYIMWLLICCFLCLRYSMSLCFHFYGRSWEFISCLEWDKQRNSITLYLDGIWEYFTCGFRVLHFVYFFLPLLALPSEGETDDSPVWPALHIMKPPTALQEAGGRSDWRSGLIHIIRPPELHQLLVVIKNTC